MADSTYNIDFTSKDNFAKTTANAQRLETAVKDLARAQTALSATGPRGGTWLDTAMGDPKKMAALKTSATAMSAVGKAMSDVSKASMAMDGVNIDKTIERSAAAFGKFATQLHAVTPLNKEQVQDLTRTAQVATQAAKAVDALADAELKRARAQSLINNSQANLLDADTRQYRALEATERRQEAAALATQRHSQAIERSRYAARDLARTYTILAASLAALPVAGVKFASEQERAFADVKRTTQAASDDLDRLAASYRDLSTKTTLDFGELSEIGTLGAQMNIATSELEDFTRATGEFSTVTGASVDASATAFGRIRQMMGGLQESQEGAGDGFAVLANQIAFLGARSVATEPEVMNMATSLAAQAKSAGLSQNELLALSTTLASLAIPKEWARGSIQRIFGKINAAVANGGDALTNFASQLGVTEGQFKQMWANDPNDLFMRLNASIASVTDKAERAATIRGLGFTSVRDVELLTRTSQNLDLYAQSLENAEASSKNTNFIDSSMAIIMETLAGHMEAFVHALQNAAASMGTGFGAGLKVILAAATGLLNAFTKLPDGLRNFISAGLGIGAMVAAVKAVQAGVISLAGSYANMTRNMNTLTGTTTLGWGNVKRAMQEAGLIAKTTSESHAQGFGRVSAAASAAQVKIASYTAAVRGKTAAEIASVTWTKTQTAVSNSATGAMNAMRSAAQHAGKGLKAMWAAAGGWVGVGIAAAIWAITEAIEAYSASTKTAADHAKDFIDSAGGTDSILGAVVKDSQEVAAGIQQASGSLKIQANEVATSYEVGADASYYWINAQGEVVTASEEVAKQMGYTALAIGDNTKAMIINAMAGDEGLKKLSAGAAKAISATGFNLYKAMEKLAADDTGNAYREYVNKHLAEMEAILKAGQAKLNEVYIQGGTDHKAISELKQQYNIDALTEAIAYMNSIKSGAEGVGGALQEVMAKATLMGQTSVDMDGVDSGLDTTTDKAKDLTDALDEIVQELFGMSNASIAAADSLAGVAQSIYENGTSMDIATEAGRANVQAVQEYLADLARATAMGAQELGLTGAEAQQYIHDTMSAAIDYLAEQGLDMSQFEQFPMQIQELLGQQYQLGGVDTSVMDAGLVAAQNNAAAAAASISSALGAVGISSSTSRNVTNMLNRKFGVNGHTQSKSVNSTPKRKQSQPAWGATALAPKTKRQNGFDPSAFSNWTPKSTSGGGSRGDGGSRGSKGASQAVKTAEELFEDFLSRLNTAMKKSIDTWWSSIDAQDNYHKSLNSIRSGLDSTKKKIDDLRDSNSKLRADLLESEQKLHDAQFFNKVAVKYNDTERIKSTNTDINTAKADIADKKAQIAANEKEASTLQKGMYALTGYTDAAIANRAALKGLQEQMVGLIEDYARSGASTQQIQAYTARLKQEFINQATQMGFNRSEVVKLAGSFDSLKTTIAKVPRTVNVNASDGGSVGRVKNAIGSIPRSVSVGVSAYFDQASVNRVLAAYKKTFENLKFDPMGNQVFPYPGRSTKYSSGGLIGFAGGGYVPGTPPHAKSADNLLATNGRGLFQIRSGEFVISQPAVDFYGRGLMQAINTRSLPVIPTQTNSASVDVVTLNPQQFAMLVQAVNTTVALDGKAISKSMNRGNRNLGSRGVY